MIRRKYDTQDVKESRLVLGPRPDGQEPSPRSITLTPEAVSSFAEGLIKLKINIELILV